MDMPEKPDSTLSQGDISSLIEAASENQTTSAKEEDLESEAVSNSVEETVQSEMNKTDSASVKTEANDNSINNQYSVNIQRVLDISLPVTVSFGTAKRTLNEVLKMAPGTLLELDKSAEDPVVLKVNNKVFAWGRVVDVDGYYGVEITDIMTQADRIVSLGEA